MKKYKIIIVENDEDEQQFMKEGFDSAALFDIVAQVRQMEIHYLNGLIQTKNSLPDVILVRFKHAGKNGYDVINEVKTNPLYSHIPVVITSTSSTKTIIDKCFVFRSGRLYSKAGDVYRICALCAEFV